MKKGKPPSLSTNPMTDKKKRAKATRKSVNTCWAKKGLRLLGLWELGKGKP